MGRSRALAAAIGLLAVAAVALGAGTTAAPAWGANRFQPRVGRAMGLLPPVIRRSQVAGDVASGALTPVTYHGGPVMSGGVRLHTIFWAPSGFAFQGSPGNGIPTYKGLIQQFFTDVAGDAAAPGTCNSSGCNVFTIERQYGQGTSPGQVTPGSYSFAYSASADSIDATDPYPSKSSQCASPAGAAVCLTDNQVASEVDHIVQSTGGGRGLHNLWFVFLPPGVDECINAGVCGTNSFAGYHAVFNLSGHGATIYAVAIDPIIEGPAPSGTDPQGYPDAELELDIAAHEINEAVTDPEGDGWMDPNGFEVGDKCDTGPQTGIPLGFAPDGSNYNQVIGGHQYLLQEEWANADSAGNDNCVQATTTTASQLPLPQVYLRQFDPLVSGNVRRSSGSGIRVRVSLVRSSSGSPLVVARASTTTQPDGSWHVWLWPHAPGDDRDQINVDYSGAGAPQPSHQVILTGNGGNPFTEAGWMGWMAMDNGSALSNASSTSSLSLAPCFQAGALSFSLDGAAAAQPPPNESCNTETDVATQAVAHVARRDSLTWTSNDNRAFDAPTSPSPNLFGGLISMTVPVGEPGSVSSFASPLPAFTPGGFPSCQADLELQAVQCTGLVPRERYILHDHGYRVPGIADGTGTLLAVLPVTRGDSVALSNGSRTLTTLHVAHLKVHILGDETSLAGGRCQAGEYYGPPLTKIPLSAAAGLPSPLTTGGVALTGAICPPSGNAAGLSTKAITQTDELSGGQTTTEVPDLLDTSPIDGETMYGRFIARATSGLTLPGNQVIPADGTTRIALRITTPVGASVLSIHNVDTAAGAAVPALRRGSYYAIWTLADANGDTRVAVTRFIEARGQPPANPNTRVAVRFTGASDFSATVTFPGGRGLTGSVRLRLTRGGRLVALGHAWLRHGRATVAMRELQRVRAGRWRVTLVLVPPHLPAITIRANLGRVG